MVTVSSGASWYGLVTRRLSERHALRMAGERRACCGIRRREDAQLQGAAPARC